MPARTRKDAADAYVARLRRIDDCVTDQPLLAFGYRPETQAYQVSFLPAGEFVRLRNVGREWSIGLSIVETYTIEDERGQAPFDARRTGYWYEILDLAGREIFAFHWHPIGISPVTYPHAHLTNRIGRIDLAGGGSVALGDMHAPTGHLDFGDLVRFLITEFGVEPRRADWESILRTP